MLPLFVARVKKQGRVFLKTTDRSLSPRDNAAVLLPRVEPKITPNLPV